MLPSADTKRFLLRVEMTNLLLGVVVIVVALAWAGWNAMSAGVVTGAVVAAVNWRAVVWLAAKLMAGGTRPQKVYAMIAGSKLVLLSLTVWLALALLPISPFGFLLGVSTLIPAIFGCSLMMQTSIAGSEG